MMKKMVVSVVLSVLLLASCGTATEEKSLYVRGMEVVSMLDELAGNEEYLTVYTATPEILELAATMAEGDRSSPKTVYEITVPEEMLLALAEVDGVSGLSDELRTYLLNRTQSTVPVTVNSRNGVETLAATSVCTVGKSFVNSDVTAGSMYLYTFEDAVPVMVTFTPGEDHTVSASATFLMGEIDTSSADTVAAFFEEYGATVSVVPAE